MANRPASADHLRTIDMDGIAPAGTQVVYFVGMPGREIKIGYTASLKERFGELRKRVHLPVQLLAVAYGGRSLELDYHNQFAATRAHGEWFAWSSEIEAEISRLSTPPRITKEGE